MQLRAGKITGSSDGKIMANYGKAFGEPAKAIAVEIADIMLGGSPSDNGHTNAHMERGHEEEPIARMKYQEEYFCEVGNGGFFDNGKTGCSPDGIVDGGNLIEIKSVIKAVHYACLKRKSYDPKYKWQLIFNLKESGAEWIDFVSFCSTMNDKKKLYVSRIYAEDVQKEFEMIDSRLAEFWELVEETKRNILKA